MLPPSTRLITLLAKAALFVVLVTAPSRVLGQVPDRPEKPAATAEAVPATLTVWNRPIAVFRASNGAFTPAQRAAGARQRIAALPLDTLDDPIESREVLDEHGVLIVSGTTVLFGLLELDVDKEGGETLESAAQAATSQLREAFDARLEQRRLPVLLRFIGWAIGSLVVIVLAVIASRTVRRWVLARFDAAWRDRSFPVAGIDIWPFVRGLVHAVVSAAALGTVLGAADLLLTVCLNQMPYTRPWAAKLGVYTGDLLLLFARAVIAALPGIGVVIVVFLVTRFVARTVDGLLERAKSDKSGVWFRPDTIDATRRIARVLIWLFAIVVAYPFVPGSSSTAFKGVSVFAGVVLSLGSSGLANQILSGLVLVYSRALRPGDVVTVGETFGVVTEIGTVSTKIFTPQREEVTIPNTLMLGSSVTNYTRTDAMVSTTVTIGYDAPWRQVESLLQLAAERTPGLRREPPPIVWQRALSDFYVEYTLLCPIERQVDRYPVLADLHSKIQDAFNEFGVQIMSPHFLSQPDGRVIAPPESWYARPARQPAAASGEHPPSAGTAPPPTSS